jgi:serine/threonine protein kinase
MSSPQSFAHYTVVEKIGAGGMGEVLRATDSQLNRDVALKMLPDTLIDNAERLARFQREAQVLAQLNHHGIAAIYGLESEGSRHALAMELVEGPDLSDKLTSGSLPTAEALDIALQLAEAVESAHEKGIVHRDLKPANIKINTEGRVKVLDFGLAKALSDDPATSGIDPAMSPTLTANMTMGNVILGTAAYMSPEQARGTEVDKRADIWAYGVVLVEMLGGRHLFAGETVSDTLASVLQASIDLDDLPKDLPASVKRMIKRCLQRDPRQRLRDIGDARLILQDAINGPDEVADEAPRPKGNSWLQWGVVAVAVVAVTAAMMGYLSPSGKRSCP